MSTSKKDVPLFSVVRGFECVSIKTGLNIYKKARLQIDPHAGLFAFKGRGVLWIAYEKSGRLLANTLKTLTSRLFKCQTSGSMKRSKAF